MNYYIYIYLKIFKKKNSKIYNAFGRLSILREQRSLYVISLLVKRSACQLDHPDRPGSDTTIVTNVPSRSSPRYGEIIAL